MRNPWKLNMEKFTIEERIKISEFYLENQTEIGLTQKAYSCRLGVRITLYK